MGCEARSGWEVLLGVSLLCNPQVTNLGEAMGYTRSQAAPKQDTTMVVKTVWAVNHKEGVMVLCSLCLRVIDHLGTGVRVS